MAVPSVPRKNPPTEQLVLLNDELKGRAALQSDELEGLDRKASTMFAGTGVVLGLVVNNVDKYASILDGPRNIFYGSLVALAAALVAGVMAIWPRSVKAVPKPRRLVEGYYGRSMNDTLAHLVSIRLVALEMSKNVRLRKAGALRVQMVLLAAGGVGLVVAYLTKDFT